MKKVRDELADYVFTGELLDPAEISIDARERPAGIEHAVYRNLKNGKRACIITNRGAAPAAVSLVGFGELVAGRVRFFRPGQSATTLTTPAQLTVAPERVVFVVEN